MARMDRQGPEQVSMRRWRRVGAVATLIAALAMYAVFLWPIARHGGTDILRSSRIAAGDSSCRVALASGDHLQLLYHFQLVAQMARGDIPLFANPWEFNLGEDARNPDPYYVPFSLIYAALERPLGTAGAWNAAQLASVLVGALLLFALARRYTATPLGEGWGGLIAFAATIAALSVPYRWETLAGGSPTGFGMAWVPGVALGIDIAVRDRRASGGLLAGLMLLFCYTTDLHCFLFAGLAIPLWCIVAWLAGPRSPVKGPRRRLEAQTSSDREASVRHPCYPCHPCEISGGSEASVGHPCYPCHPCETSGIREALRVSVALTPLAACGAIALAIARHLRRAYATTDAAGGRTIAELRCPNWDALLDPTSGSLMASQFFLGWGLVLAVLVAAAIAAWRAFSPTRLRREAPSGGGLSTGAGRAAAVAALLLALAVFGAILLAMAQRGPMQGIVLRATRKLIPPFRMVRQPIKVFCLLPTLLAPLFAWMLSEIAARRRGGDSRQPSVAVGSHRAALALTLALPLVCVIPVARSMRAGTCVLPREPSGAYAAAVADARARGETPRALVLPIWPGDSAWSSVYQFHAVASGLRMVNGYAAVKTPGYVEEVFGRFQTVTQGELTDDDLAVLARYGVNTIILHEDLFPEKVSPAPVGTTLRRLLAHPALELVAQDGPVWAWRILPTSAAASSAPLPTSASAPSRGCAPAARAWHFDPPFQPTPGRPLKAPLHKTATWMRESFRWQIVREDGSVETLPPGEEDARGTSWLRLDSGAPVSDLLFAPEPFVEPGFLPAADLFHAGFTVRDESGALRGVDISGIPVGAAAIYGPKLLLREPGTYAVRVRGTLRTGDRLDVFLGRRPMADPSRWFAARPADGPLEIRLITGGTGPCLVEGFELEKVESVPYP